MAPTWIRERSGGDGGTSDNASTPRPRPRPLVMGSTPLPRPSPHTPAATKASSSTRSSKRRLVQTSISAHLVKKVNPPSRPASEPRASTASSSRRTSMTPLAARDANVDRPSKRIKGDGKGRQLLDDDDDENTSPWNGSLVGGGGVARSLSRPAPRIASPAFDPLAVFGPAPPATMSSQRGLSRATASTSPLKQVHRSPTRSPSAEPPATPFMHESLSNFAGLDWERGREERMLQYRRLAGLSPKEKKQEEARRQARIHKAERELQAAVQRSMGDRVRSWTGREEPATDGEATAMQRLGARRPLTPSHARDANRHATPPLPRGRQEKHAEAMLERISSLSPEQRHRIVGRTLERQRRDLGEGTSSSSSTLTPLVERFKQGGAQPPARLTRPAPFNEAAYSIVHVMGDLDAASSEAEDDEYAALEVGDVESDPDTRPTALESPPHIRSPHSRRRIYALETQHPGLAASTSPGGVMSDPLPESPTREVVRPRLIASPADDARYDLPSSSQTLPGGTLSPPRRASQRITATALLSQHDAAAPSDDDATQPLTAADVERYGPIESPPTQDLFNETYMSDSPGDSTGGGDYFDGMYDETYRAPRSNCKPQRAERSLPERSTRPKATLRDRTTVQPAIERGTPRAASASKRVRMETPTRGGDERQPLADGDETQLLPFASEEERPAAAGASTSQTQPLTWGDESRNQDKPPATAQPPALDDTNAAPVARPPPRKLPRWQALQDVWDGVDLGEPSQLSSVAPTPSHLQSSLDRFGFSRRAEKRRREDKWLGPEDESRRLELSDDEGEGDATVAQPLDAAPAIKFPASPASSEVSSTTEMEETQALPWVPNESQLAPPQRGARTESQMSAAATSEMSSQGMALLPSPDDMDSQARRFLGR